jgi:GNAT superfamily N-acetyltransferase
MARYTFGSRDPRQPFTFVAIEDDVLCGFATAGPSRDTDVPQRGELFALYVDPPAWGRGTGRRLMVRSREHLCRGGFTEAVLWVLVGNDRAERFYRADGWLPDGRRQSDEIWGVTVDETCYRRDLP